MHKYYRRLANLALTAVMVAGVSLVAPPAKASAILFQLDDSTDAIYDKVYKDSVLKIDAPTCCDMISGLFHFSDAGMSAGNLTSNVNVRWNIYEADGTTLSDTLSLVGTSGTNGLQIDFVSDAWTPFAALTGAQSVIETGDWQTALNIVLSNGDTFNFQFRSAETPLPGAIWLFGTVLAGATGVRKWCRRRMNTAALAAA